MGGVHGFLEGGGAFSCEGELVGAGGDDFIAGVETAEDFGAIGVDFAYFYGDADEGVFEFVIADEDEFGEAIALEGGAGDAHDIFAFVGADEEADVHSGAELVIWVFDGEDDAGAVAAFVVFIGAFGEVLTEGAGGIGAGAGGEAEEFSLEFLVGFEGDGDFRGGALFYRGGLLLGHRGDGVHFFEFGDFAEDVCGFDGGAEDGVDGEDGAVGWGVEPDAGRRVAGLAAFQEDEGHVFFDVVADGEVGFDDSSGDAAGEDGAIFRDGFEGAEGFDVGCEVGFLGDGGFDVEVVFGCGIEGDDVFFWFASLEAGDGDEECEQVFHGVILLEVVSFWGVRLRSGCGPGGRS